MQNLLALFMALVCLYGVLKYFKENALKQVEYIRAFDKDKVFAGDQVTMTIEIRNHKFMPLPWLRIAAEYPVHLAIQDQALEKSGGPFKYKHISVTSLFSFQRVVKKYALTSEKRGHFTFCDVDIKAGDWFGLEKAEETFYVPSELVVYPKVKKLSSWGFEPNAPDGGVSIQRWTMPDPIEKIGIRAYSGHDPMHSIDWKATARRGSLMVAEFDHYAQSGLMLLLNTTQPEADWKYKSPVHLEVLVSLAASLVEACIVESIPVGMAHTAAIQSAVTEQIVMAQNTHQHRVVMLEMLAKLSEYNRLSASEMIDLYQKRYTAEHAVFYLTQTLTEPVMLRLNALVGRGYEVHFAALEASEFDQFLNAGIRRHLPVVEEGHAHV